MNLLVFASSLTHVNGTGTLELFALVLLVMFLVSLAIRWAWADFWSRRDLRLEGRVLTDQQERIRRRDVRRGIFRQARSEFRGTPRSGFRRGLSTGRKAYRGFGLLGGKKKK